MSDYTDKDFVEDMILSQVGSHMATDRGTELHRPSYDLGAYDAYVNIAIMMGFLMGTEDKARLSELAAKAAQRMDDHSEVVEL